MTSSELISLFAFVISLIALIITYLTFKREKKKANQDLLFQEKINAYKDISYLGNKVYREFFDVVNSFQFYEGNSKKWKKNLSTFQEIITQNRLNLKIQYQNTW